jgi:putative sterol carrier protein
LRRLRGLLPAAAAARSLSNDRRAGAGAVSYGRRMSATTQEITDYFEQLPVRADPESVRGFAKACTFVIEGAGTWTVFVDDGAIDVLDGEAEAQCRVTMSAAVFERILHGRQKPTSAYLTGKMKISGELATLLRLQPLLAATA